jgi:hypothetical protein
MRRTLDSRREAANCHAPGLMIKMVAGEERLLLVRRPIQIG